MRDLFSIDEPQTESGLILPDLSERFSPRPYQDTAIGNFNQLVDSRASIGGLVRICTGGGKTFVGAWCAADWLRRGDDYYVIVLAHERQLISQFAEEIEDVLGIRPGIEMAEQQVIWGRRDTPRIIVASRQTLLVDKDGNSRLYKFDWKKNWLLVPDEAHRYKLALKSCSHVFEWFGQNPKSYRLGLTATPERTDGVTLFEMFPDVIIDYPMYNLDGGPSAVNDGFAVPFDQRYITVAGIDFTNLKDVRGDFADDELEQILQQKEQLDSLIKPMLDLVGKRQTIIFNPGRDMAKAVAGQINAIRDQLRDDGQECVWGEAKALDGSFPDELRQAIYKEHQSKQFQFLSVCGLCREGYNDRNIGAVAIFRPTKSRSLAEQMKGRGCRPLKGCVDGLATPEERKAAIAASEKPTCMVIDLVGATGLGEVPTTIDLIASGKPDRIIDRAKKKSLEAEGEQDLQELIAEAEREIKEEDEQALIAKQQKEEAERIAEERRLEDQRRQVEAQRMARLNSRVNYHEQRIEPGQGGAVPQEQVREEFRFKSGKHAGKPMRECPDDYLVTLVQKSHGKIKRLAQYELERRNGRPQQIRNAHDPNGPMTEAQQRLLSRYGREAFTFGQAAEIIHNDINPLMKRGIMRASN